MLAAKGLRFIFLIKLQVPWPVSIVLDRVSEDKYNEVFRFIFKTKRAIWVLEQLRFQGNIIIHSILLYVVRELNLIEYWEYRQI